MNFVTQYLEMRGIETHEHDENFIEKSTAYYVDDNNPKHLKNQLDYWVKNIEVHRFKKRHNLEEINYPLAGKDDLHSYEGYEGWKGKIIYMDPDKFLSLINPLPSWDERKESMKNLEYRIKNHLPLDFLVLWVDMEQHKIIGHEGRHRAIISKKLGIEKVPVLVYTGNNFKRVPEWKPEDHANN